jgi:hypothetical protein
MRIRKSVACVITLLAAVSVCAKSAKKAALLPESEAQSVTRMCSRNAPRKVDGSWRPTLADLDLLESRLPQISKLKSEGGVQLQNPGGYYRQYVAIVIGGHQFIYINGLCRKPESNWREHLEIICDGDCDWGVLYDPSTGEFSDLQVNGIA